MATPKPKERQTYLRSKSLAPSSQKSLKQPISPRSTGAPSSTDPKDKSSTTSADKSVPNYLKPTLSTRSESLKYVKKSSVDDPKITRRRSFDRPLTTAPRLNKSVVSPDTRDRPKFREKVTTLKSSSFPAKPITNAPKPASDKVVKTSIGNKVGKTPSRVLNKASSSSKIGVGSSASKKTRVTRVVRDPETRNDSKGCDGEEILKADGDEVVDLETSVKKEQVVDSVDSEVENDDQEEKMKSDVSTISEEENLSETAHIEDQIGEEEDEITKIEPNENQIRESDEEVIDSEPPEEMHSIEQAKTETEENKSDPDDNPIEETKSKAEEEEEEDDRVEQEKNLDVKTEKESSGDDDDIANEDNKSSDAKIDDDDDDVVEENQLEKIKSPKESGESVEEEQQHVHEEEGKIETSAPNVAGKRYEGQGRKESPGAYNDVIEECANKFLEKKKNKVKALVGAFETVIDYESK